MRSTQSPRCPQRWRVRRAFKECAHAFSAVSLLGMAAALNFSAYPDALADVLTGETQIVGFVPDAPSGNAVTDKAAIVLDESEVRLLAATAWGEARSEGEDGMRAVAHVMVNRVGSRFGEDLATVILSPRQFSVWNRSDPNRRLVHELVRNPDPYTGGENAAAWDVAQRVAREVLSGESIDPTNGALFYHTRAVRPRWASQGVGRQTIGAHIFYADVPDAGVRRTPRLIDVAQTLRLPLAQTRAQEPAAEHGARAGRVNGVIQYAPPASAAATAPAQPAPSAPVDSVETSADYQAAVSQLPTSRSF